MVLFSFLDVLSWNKNVIEQETWSPGGGAEESDRARWVGREQTEGDRGGAPGKYKYKYEYKYKYKYEYKYKYKYE